MTPKQRARAEAAIRAFVGMGAISPDEAKCPIPTLDAATKRLIAIANQDLYSGPVYEPDDGMPWPGFSTACDLISRALPEGDLYVDLENDSVSDVEPDWDEHYSDDFVRFGRLDIARAIVGSELAAYV